LSALLSTDIAKTEGTYSLFLKCAYLGGLRSFETVQLDCQDVVDPKEDPNIVVYKVGFLRKGAFPKPINITSTLMRNLYEYTLSATWKKRALKHEIAYGKDNPEYPLPLFINSAGERMAETAASDTISYVRKEQREKNQTLLVRTFHDLRSTFGTYLAIYLFEKFDDPKRVRNILRKWMGHEDFKTTEGYLDFAKAVSDPSEYGAMHQWVIDIYDAVNELEEDMEEAV
jgi:integrase